MVLHYVRAARILCIDHCAVAGVEIAKNIVLMGVKSLTLHDTDAVQLRDLSSNFFLSESDVGKPRASAVRAKLQELNDRCDVQVHDGELTEQFVAGNTHR